MIVKSFFAAERVIRDAESGNVTIVGLLEDIKVESFPFILPRLSTIIHVEKKETESDSFLGIFRIFNNSIVIGSSPIKIQFKEIQKTRSIVNVNNLTISEPGVIRLELREMNDGGEHGAIIGECNISVSFRDGMTVVSE